MGKFIDLIGQRFGRLIVVSRAENDRQGQAQWNCVCDCGNFSIVRSRHLKYGRVKSCGCYHLERDSECHTKHSLSETRLYKIYLGMKQRCYNTKNHAYKHYGGRGITICAEWLDKDNSFINFYNWAMSNGYRSDLSIDRIDVNGNYEPCNCRWATAKEQQNNRRNNRKK